jgi:hypothetical protein
MAEVINLRGAGWAIPGVQKAVQAAIAKAKVAQAGGVPINPQVVQSSQPPQYVAAPAPAGNSGGPLSWGSKITALYNKAKAVAAAASPASDSGGSPGNVEATGLPTEDSKLPLYIGAGAAALVLVLVLGKKRS